MYLKPQVYANNSLYRSIVFPGMTSTRIASYAMSNVGEKKHFQDIPIRVTNTPLHIIQKTLYSRFAMCFLS